MEIIFKDRIRALRQERGETQVQVAEAIGVAESHYQRFERGANLPNLETDLAGGEVLQRQKAAAFEIDCHSVILLCRLQDGAENFRADAPPPFSF